MLLERNSQVTVCGGTYFMTARRELRQLLFGQRDLAAALRTQWIYCPNWYTITSSVVFSSVQRKWGWGFGIQSIG